MRNPLPISLILAAICIFVVAALASTVATAKSRIRTQLRRSLAWMQRVHATWRNTPVHA